MNDRDPRQTRQELAEFAHREEADRFIREEARAVTESNTASYNPAVLCARADCLRPRGEHGETTFQIDHVWESPGATVEIPLVQQVTVAVRQHYAFEDTWEVFDVTTGEVVDTVEVDGGEDAALEAAVANALDYLKDDAKHSGW